jgi:hypothetical protein
VSLSQEPQQQEKKRIYEDFQESTLIIIHFQHVKRFSLVLANFIFLPHILQLATICRHFLFFFMNVLRLVAAIAAGIP